MITFKTPTKYPLTESRSNYKPKVVKLSSEDMETIYDINRLWEIGTFRYIPEAVSERLLSDHIIGNFGKLKDGNVSFDTVADPNNPISIPHNILTRMGLEVLRLYLMGVDPYMRAVVRRVITSNGETLHLKRIMYGVSHSEVYFASTACTSRLSTKVGVIANLQYII